MQLYSSVRRGTGGIVVYPHPPERSEVLERSIFSKLFEKIFYGLL